ncbi:hypothetical protein KSF_052760 [Reticulibacter mediterranei]|uniref:Uncharacterized protein n=1 Tax=Reticulibacter mediterranei TaxID=2778369 RepID=A0A8J3N488_9CHLR|nr:hypothetical protein [Reticulibacter mediterranei]GHO95228.1 hypothetical protein KSF_052760 [Reticulibacter mediterranei]
MSQHSEKYLHFNVGLLKESFALQALWQDALKYHMIDQPGKLIALRLTEYYELVARGMLPQGTSAPFSAAPTISTHGVREDTHPRPAINNNGNHRQSEDEQLLSASQEADHNAEEAADYWSVL